MFHRLNNELYVAVGTNGKDYVGASADVRDAIYNYTKYDGNTDYNNPIEFNKLVYNIPYHQAPDDQTELKPADQTILSADDVLFAENTLVLVSGMLDEAKQGYAFAGWYEQKYSKNTGNWSDLELMSTDLNYPYVSVANADTVIIALFKKVVETVASFNEAELSVQYSSANAAD